VSSLLLENQLLQEPSALVDDCCVISVFSQTSISLIQDGICSFSISLGRIGAGHNKTMKE